MSKTATQKTPAAKRAKIRVKITLTPEEDAALTRWMETSLAGRCRSRSNAISSIVNAYLGVTARGMPGFGVG